VTVGFCHTTAESVSFRLTATGVARCPVGWRLEALAAHARGEGTAEALDSPDAGNTPLGLLTLHDGDGTTPGLADGPLGFALLDTASIARLSDRALTGLAARCSEAIRASRRNSVRLALEGTVDRGATPIKDVIYGLLDHLPEWLGVDHSASLLIAPEMSAVVELGAALHAMPTYDVMAERLFFAEDPHTTRLVGMSLPTGKGEGLDGVLASAVRVQCDDPARRYHRYLPAEGTETTWRAIEGEDLEVEALTIAVDRPAVGRRILVPLVTHQLDGEGIELIGWLDLRWRYDALLPASTGPMLQLVSDALAARVRASAIYTLSARQAQLVTRIREDVVAALRHDDLETRVDTFVARVVERMATMPGLPSFSIGRVQPGPKPILRFVHAHGWTGFDALELPIHAEDVGDAGVVGLAVRLGRPIVLAGGSRVEDGKAWNNTVWVHEERGELSDSRLRGEAELEADGWRRLSEYYRSARAGTYATLAFPVVFGSEILGVIAVEVERTTTWLWWSGLGSQLFYHLLGSELAMGFKLLETL